MRSGTSQQLPQAPSGRATPKKSRVPLGGPWHLPDGAWVRALALSPGREPLGPAPASNALFTKKSPSNEKGAVGKLFLLNPSCREQRLKPSIRVFCQQEERV